MSYPVSDLAQPLSMHDFHSRVESIKLSITSLSTQIQVASNTFSHITTHEQITTAITSFSQTSKQIFNDITLLADNTHRTPHNQDISDKLQHINLLIQQLRQELDSLHDAHFNIERKNRCDLARQFRIVHPGATNEEMKNAVDGTLKFNHNVFSQATLSGRTNGASNALSAARVRYLEVAQIENTMVELNELFTMLAEHVDEQQVHVDHIEKEGENVCKDVKRANVHLDKAVKSGRRRRRNKWRCLLCMC